eukprot:CAMPEP_0194154432 /NCGR_PEP_ID=MMETSP0152-20130528/60617_1 /TAXON_ID=1049557 /ORGANISM="Thalassiothrix antarctica, Strain L6-D1" /LENGTH=482 /DNA_ID=CAMNT_0038860537 /DNA_START=16 /DNA_END=1461 /DNA_ORIENTATION=+
MVVYDSITTRWTKQYNLNTPRYCAAAIVYDNNLCVLGGSSSIEGFEATVEVWNEEEQSFTLNDSPLILTIPKCSFGILKTKNNELLALGGNNQYTNYQGSSLLQKIDDNKIHYSSKCAKNAVSSNVEYWEYLKDVCCGYKEVVLEVLKKDSNQLEYLDKKWKKDKDIILEAVKRDGNSLQFADEVLRKDKEIVFLAIQESPEALKYAALSLKQDIDIVMEALKKDGNSLQFAGDILRKDRNIVLAAIRKTPEALKFAEPPLNQDHELLIVAGLFDEGHDINNKEVLIVLSTRFSLAKESSPTATQFALLLKENLFIQKQKFHVYSPNSWMKSTCDLKWTDINHLCRGDFITCEMKDADLKRGVPQERKTCWRVSFRYQLKKAEERKGFMVQVVEYYKKEDKHILGDGQSIETEIAELVNCKVFRAYQPYDDTFDEYNIKEIVSKIKEWNEDGCQDMANCDIKCTSKRERVLAAVKQDGNALQ